MKPFYSHLREDHKNFDQEVFRALCDSIKLGQISYNCAFRLIKQKKIKAFTTCRLKNSKYELVGCGYAFCVDNFCKKDGRSISKGRAEENYMFNIRDDNSK